MNNKRLNYQDLGRRIRQLREKRGCTTEELAKALKRTPHFVAQLETGAVIPDLDMLLAICDRLNTLPEKVLYDQDSLSRQVFKGLAASHLSCMEDEVISLIDEICQRIKHQRAAG